MSESNKKIEKLDVHNYATWSVKMKAVLVTEGVWKPVVGQAAGAGSADKDEKALALITLNVADHHLSQLKACDTAKDAWDKLAAVYKAKSIARRLTLRKALYALKLGHDEQVSKYVSRAKDIRDELVASGYAVRDDELVLAVLGGLPQGYEMVATMLEGEEDEQDLDDVLPRLLLVEQRLQRGSEKVADNRQQSKAFVAGASHKAQGATRVC